MKAHDVEQSPYTISPRGTALTYDKYIIHEKYGIVRMRIHRAIGNDSGLKAQMTQELLSRYEPKVGMWSGDVIEIFDQYGLLLERKVH